jgi:hypothetical protein
MLVLWWESSCILTQKRPISIPRPDLESSLDSTQRLITKKIQFDIIILVYGGPGVDRRWKISNFGQMFHSKKIKYRDPFSHIWFIGKLMVSSNGIMWKIQDFQFFSLFLLEIDRNSMMADIDSHFEGVLTFFLWKFPILSHFLITPLPGFWDPHFI